MNQFVENGVTHPHIFEIVGMAADVFQPNPERRASRRHSLGFAQEDTIITYIGSLGPSRGLPILRQAATMIGQCGIRFLIVGGSDEDVAREKALCSEAGLAKQFIFTGFLTRQEVSDVFQAADGLLVSYSRSLPAVDVMNPMKVHEYLATDLPILYPRLPRVQDIISADDPGAISYDCDSPSSLAAALVHCTKSFDRSAIEAFRGPKRITWDLLAQRWESIVQRTAGW
jgi:glycosyltransferase involved in cell wall biosynthesis